MIGTVTRVDAGGVYVRVPDILPGIDLGPCLALVHRVVVDAVDHVSEYAEGDSVQVLEVGLNEYVVLGIVPEPA